MKKILLFVMIMTMFISCGPSQDELLSQKMQGLSEMAELGTVEYTVKKIVLADPDAWYKYGKRTIMFSCTAFIKAGIDMKEFSPDNVKVDQESKSISVILPKAKILSFNMPPEEIKEEFIMVTGFRNKFSIEEKQNLLVLGEKDIKDDIPNMGIIEDAQANAKLFFTALFTQLGYERITIKFE